ncbi:hypothetical protein [Marinicella litoralis]|uniref:hypothetical protein n=1 Tax=Marinicella litoralis TaxID=644220 RepID=UPI0013C2A3C4|nr:hypothetical protein [Marinicella litoralis]
MSLNNLWAVLAINAFSVAMLLTWYSYGYRSVITDHANNRSLHQGKAVTGGGVLMFLPLCVSLWWINPSYWPAYILLAISLLGLADDKFDLSFKLRLLIQTVLIVVCLIYFEFALGLLFVFLTFACLWWVNLFNFMDGANGMAGLHSLVVAVFYGYIFQESDMAFVSLSLLATVIIVYLVFNLYLKRLFMGDSGSLPMAMLLAIFAFDALQSGLLSYYQVALVHGAFITDTTLTLWVRLKKGENITQAHATHLYQRLVKSQSAHSTVSAFYAIVTALLCLLAIAMDDSSRMIQISTLIISYALLVLIFMKYFRIGR